MSEVATAPVTRPGRWCPPSYGLGPSAFAAAPKVHADVVYVAGGLYGNGAALARLIELFDREPAARKQLVLNGDFHWFDRSEQAFAAIERDTSRFIRLRGNVETELAADGDDAGCGCAYPDSVSDEDVERSNAILRDLKRTARALGVDQRLGQLSPVARACCEGLEIAITHGDDRSLAGWELAADRVDASWRDGLVARMRTLGVSLIASSHTCLAVADTAPDYPHDCAIINNGAAGLANFQGDPSGLFTRIASSRWADTCAETPLYRASLQGVDVAAVPIRFEQSRWRSSFLADWPEGSAAHRSYWNRLVFGPNHSPDQAARGRFRRVIG
ncbi:MAG: hypothetical protein ACKO8O_08855 [Betaproteobacteria bacterium]